MSDRSITNGYLNGFLSEKNRSIFWTFFFKSFFESFFEGFFETFFSRIQKPGERSGVVVRCAVIVGVPTGWKVLLFILIDLLNF